MSVITEAVTRAKAGCATVDDTLLLALAVVKLSTLLDAAEAESLERQRQTMLRDDQAMRVALGVHR